MNSCLLSSISLFVVSKLHYKRKEVVLGDLFRQLHAAKKFILGLLTVSKVVGYGIWES